MPKSIKITNKSNLIKSYQDEDALFQMEKKLICYSQAI